MNKGGWALTTPGGPDHLPRTLAQERKMVHPPYWSLYSPLNGCYYSHGHPEQMVRTKVVAQGIPYVYRAHRAQTFCLSDL